MSTFRVLITSFCVFGILDAAKRNDLCTTPDDRAGICVSIDDCEDMVKAISSRVNRTAIQYAQKAQCGYDTVALVCCAFIFDDHNEIFPNPPPSTATKKNDEVCTTLDTKQGTCITLNLCEGLLKPLSSRINRTAIEYAKNSQCGFDEEPLVCCEVIEILDAAKRNDLCTTPDDRAGICVSVDDCEDMVKAISSRVNRTAIQYAQKAQCGYDTVALVCCAFIFDDHNEIFPNPPPSTATKKKDEACTTLDTKQGTCIALNLCEDLLKPLSSRINRTAIEYAKNSQCGFEEKPLVCCELIVIDFLNIFESPPPTSTTTQKPKPTYNPQQQQLILEDFKTNSLPGRTVCGLHREADRIYGGGEVTEIDEFPWMGAIEYISTISNQSEGIKCGSTIINNRFLLTAAHCIIGLIVLKPVRVWLGDWNISTDPDCRTIMGIEECNDKVLKVNIKATIHHPYYSKEQKTNDIGLIRLEKDINYSEFIRPICLPHSNLPNPTVNTLMTVSGWGRIRKRYNSDTKLKVQVPLVPNRKCSEQINKIILQNQLCAGGVEGKNTCKADSGGPLMRIYTDESNSVEQWYQEGILSYGIGCGVPDDPAVYTRVSRYIDWIEGNIQESE